MSRFPSLLCEAAMTGTATKRYLLLRNISDMKNTILQRYVRPGRAACRVFSCARLGKQVSSRRNRLLASARCLNEEIQLHEGRFLPIKANEQKH
jgi:hypothetical protein